MAKTKTAPGAITGSLDEEPVQLREWGTDRVYPLPPKRAKDWLIGASPDCWLQLQDGDQFVSRRHAVLRRIDSCCSIADAGSKNGLWVDGQRVDASTLTPGIELGIGRIRLVVESPGVMRRHALLARLLGWSVDRRIAVDRALRALREFSSARFPLWLTGNDDMVAIARQLHREVRGDASPFLVAELSAKALVENMRAARGGTLCVLARRMPADARLLRDLTADREPEAGIIVCARSADQVMAIDVPRLSSRRDEIERLIDEYALDAKARLGAKASSFADVDRTWLVAHPPETHADIELATLRLIAIREFGGITHAAPRLGITHSALSRWVTRRFARSRRTTPRF